MLSRQFSVNRSSFLSSNYHLNTGGKKMWKRELKRTERCEMLTASALESTCPPPPPQKGEPTASDYFKFPLGYDCLCLVSLQ